jgi:galactose mutarotase-like enzyme
MRQPEATRRRLIVLENDRARASVYPEHGFQLHDFAARVDGRAGGDFVPAIFASPDGSEPADRRYGNPVLFPAVGVTNASEPDRWLHGGRLLPMQQHGWARDAYWHVDVIDESSVAAHLTPTTGIRAAFPFPFALALRYALEGATLVLTAELRNEGGAAFPYALGFHPYLRAPLTPAGTRQSCRIRLPSGVELGSDDGWRTIRRSPSAARSIDSALPQLPGSIVLAETGARALEVEDATAGIAARVSVESSQETFPIWVIWTASPDAPYVCLEPWTDAPNALNRSSTRTIPPGGVHRYRLALSLHAI